VQLNIKDAIRRFIISLICNSMKLEWKKYLVIQISCPHVPFSFLGWNSQNHDIHKRWSNSGNEPWVSSHQRLWGTVKPHSKILDIPVGHESSVARDSGGGTQLNPHSKMLDTPLVHGSPDARDWGCTKLSPRSKILDIPLVHGSQMPEIGGCTKLNPHSKILDTSLVHGSTEIGGAQS